MSFRAREIRGDGVHLCQVCGEDAVINMRPLPGQEVREGAPLDLDVCIYHHLKMAMGASLDIHGPEMVAHVMLELLSK